MLDRSVIRELPNGERKRFPSFNDLANFLANQGEIDTPGELEARPDLLADVFFHWVSMGQLACEFAQSLASDRDRVGWHPVVVPPPYSDRTLAALPFATDRDGQAEATAIVFPDVDAPENLVSVVNRLCEQPDWYWEVLPWEECEDDDHFRLGLRWQMPDGEHVSLALGFAPFPSMPFTRRIHGASMSVVTLRTKRPPPDIHHWYEPDDESLHLAHLEPMIRPRDAVEDMDGRTTERRDQYLRDTCEDEAAKAKVTFCLPSRVRDQLREEGREP